MRAVSVVLVLAGTLLSAGAAAQDGLSPADRVLAREIFKQLIEINTTDSLGNTPRAARAMAQRLRAAGFAAPDLRVLIGPDATHGNLVARYRGTGTGGRPIVVFAHLDVVPARRSDWSVDPFTFIEKDGYIYGRGITDDKVGDAVLIANFIRLKGDHFKPTRDLILVLTGDEETNGSCIQWLVTKHRDLVDAEFALNTDAGGGVLRDGRRVMFTVQASEKVHANYALEATDKGGQSSPPRHADNATYRLAGVLARLAAYQFPVQLNEVSRAFFKHSAAIDTGRSADDRVGVRTVYTPIPSPPSPLTPGIMGTLERLVAEQFPGVPIVPVMEAGATDGLFLRNAGIPTYGVSAVFEDPNDIRAHGRDERIGVQSFYDALEFWHRMLRAFASQQ